jgi:hypothetical protein
MADLDLRCLHKDLSLSTVRAPAARAISAKLAGADR